MLRRTLDRLEADQRATMAALHGNGMSDADQMQEQMEHLEEQFARARAQIIEQLSPDRETEAVLTDDDDIGVWWTPTPPMGSESVPYDVEKINERFRR